MHSHIKEAPVPAYTHTPRVKFEQLSNRITNTPTSPAAPSTHAYTNTHTQSRGDWRQSWGLLTHTSIPLSLNHWIPLAVFWKREVVGLPSFSRIPPERTKARGRREEEGGGYDGGRWRSWERGSKASKACEPDLTCTVFFVGGAKSAHFTVHFWGVLCFYSRSVSTVMSHCVHIKQVVMMISAGF